MTFNNHNFEEFLLLSMENASKEFRKTEEFQLWNEKSMRAYEDLKTNFCENDFDYIEDCIDILLDAECRETEFLYFHAYRDCMELLKSLNVF